MVKRLAGPTGTAVDLFCGVGGLSLGLVQSGFRLLGAVDIDRRTLETHAANFPSIPTYRCDLFTTSGAELHGALSLRGTRIDLLAGGPPCQGFSAGGMRAKKDSRNQGIMAFARLVLELRPRYFLMENVRGFLFRDHSDLRKRFQQMLKDSGYNVSPFTLLNAADFGVPQRRLRVFALGCEEGEMPAAYPAPVKRKRPTVRDAIADLVEVDRHAEGVGADRYEGHLGKTSVYATRLRPRTGRGVHHALTGCLRTIHSAEVIERFRNTKPGEQEPVSRFYRLAWEGVSPTLRAGTGPEHGSHTAPRPIHPELPRCITVREAARLHSFPDWFVFHGTHWNGFRQIGNSIPPLLAQLFGRSVLAAMGVT